MFYNIINKLGLGARATTDFLAGTTDSPGFLHKSKVAYCAGTRKHKLNPSTPGKYPSKETLDAMTEKQFDAYCTKLGV